MAVVVKNPPANAGVTRDVGLIPGLGRCPGEGNSKPLQYSCLEKPVDRGAWWYTVHGASKELGTPEHMRINILILKRRKSRRKIKRMWRTKRRRREKRNEEGEEKNLHS